LNLFLAQRLKLARNMDQFLSAAKRVPAGYAQFELGEKQPDDKTANKVLFDDDSAAVMNQRMPLTMLKEIASKQTLPAHLSRAVAVAAWTGSVLLGDQSMAEELVPVLQELEPDLKADLQACLTSPNAPARKFAGVFLILRFPGMRPYVVPGAERTEAI